MKVLIIGFSKIIYMPYIHFFLDNINSEKNEIHILYWNRDLKMDIAPNYDGLIFHEFRQFQDDYEKRKKISNFIKFRNFAKKIIDDEKFDFIIVLTTIPGILLSDILTRKYQGKYIFDYRDSTYEQNKIFKKILDRLVAASYTTFISSDGFRTLLPKTCDYKIITTHNLLIDSLLHREEKSKYGTSSNKIRIGHWGQIRNEEVNLDIIKALACDERFELHYYGREQRISLKLKAYAKSLKADNVYFHGGYVPEDRYRFVRETDIIHNIFNDKNMMMAMSNKYYDGIIFRIPQICMEGSFMGKCASHAKVGFCCLPSMDNLSDYIYQKYLEIELNRFNLSCDIELERILGEYRRSECVIQKTIEE